MKVRCFSEGKENILIFCRLFLSPLSSIPLIFHRGFHGAFWTFC